jgi:siderophore synthetase component
MLTLSKKWKLYQVHSVKFSAYLNNFIYILKELFPHYFMIKDMGGLKNIFLYSKGNINNNI